MRRKEEIRAQDFLCLRWSTTPAALYYVPEMIRYIALL